jgi:hypothetical protein
LWWQESKHPAPEDFIFANRTGGFIDPQNYRKKMRKLSEDLDVPKLTFQVIRRTIATLGQKRERLRTSRLCCALAAGDYHRRLHAGDSRKREGDLIQPAAASSRL